MLWVLGLLGSPPEPGPEPELEPEPERRSFGWLSIAPVGAAVPGPIKTPDNATFDRAVVAGYRWGFSVGVGFEPREHLLVVAASGVEQALWVFDNIDSYELCFRGDCYGWNERGFGALIRVGADLRLGWIGPRFMAWALLGAHLGISSMRLDCDNSVQDQCTRRELDLGPGFGGGIGLAYRPVDRFALGLESSLDHTRLDRRDDPFAVARTWDLAAIAVISF